MTDIEEAEWTSDEARALRGLADRTAAPGPDARAKSIERLSSWGCSSRRAWVAGLSGGHGQLPPRSPSWGSLPAAYCRPGPPPMFQVERSTCCC